MMLRSDPVGKEFYRSLNIAERYSGYLFFSAAGLSIAALLVERATHPRLSAFVQGAFIVLVVLLFISNAVIRLYLSEKAQVSRLADFVSNAFRVSLISDKSVGYYNNSEVEPIRRTASSLLENCFFTKSILAKMLARERLQVSAYSLLWFTALLFRGADLALIAAAAQVVFSEQILWRWLRMEWLRVRTERVYDDIYALLSSKGALDANSFAARVLDGLLRYETGKAQAGISISSERFVQMNPMLSERWQGIATDLGVSIPQPIADPSEEPH